jgi:hypothetical protein
VEEEMGEKEGSGIIFLNDTEFCRDKNEIVCFT